MAASLIALAICRPGVCREGIPDLVAPGRAGRCQPGEKVAPPVDLDLEVAGTPADARRQLGHDPPAEMLEGIRGRIPGREDRRTEPLDVAVDVAGDRPHVVRGDDPPTAAVDLSQDEDDAEMRQLVVRDPDRRPAEGVEDLVERIGVDRRRETVTDRGRRGSTIRAASPQV